MSLLDAFGASLGPVTVRTNLNASSPLTFDPRPAPPAEPEPPGIPGVTTPPREPGAPGPSGQAPAPGEPREAQGLSEAFARMLQPEFTVEVAGQRVVVAPYGTPTKNLAPVLAAGLVGVGVAVVRGAGFFSWALSLSTGAMIGAAGAAALVWALNQGESDGQA